MQLVLEQFSPPVAAVLKRYATAHLPLIAGSGCPADEVGVLEQIGPHALFPNARSAMAAYSGLLLLIGCWQESHAVSQQDESREGSYWHAIAHRVEPDSSNAAYWFRRVGKHPIFPALNEAVKQVLTEDKDVDWRVGDAWDPSSLIRWCEEGRQHPNNEKERLASHIQYLEWELLFSYCALNAHAL